MLFLMSASNNGDVTSSLLMGISIYAYGYRYVDSFHYGRTGRCTVHCTYKVRVRLYWLPSIFEAEHFQVRALNGIKKVK